MHMGVVARLTVDKALETRSGRVRPLNATIRAKMIAMMLGDASILTLKPAPCLPLAVDNILPGGNFCHASHNIVFFVHEQCVDFHVHSPFDMVYSLCDFTIPPMCSIINFIDFIKL